MDSVQQSFPNPPPRVAPGTAIFRERLDEDVALGCECADPALHIDRWGEEAEQPLQERN